MAECCDPAAYESFFDEKEAARSLRRYRRRGLDAMAESIVAYLESRGLAGAEVLEVGGGIGAIQVELIKAGAHRSINVELSPAYEEAAGRLATEEGLADRVTRRLGDFVELADDVEPADVVVMNRVVCCYPWMERLVGSAADKTRSFLSMVYPQDRWWVKLALRAGDLLRAHREDYVPAYFHPVAEIESVATRAGLALRHTEKSLLWRAVVLERAA